MRRARLTDLFRANESELSAEGLDKAAGFVFAVAVRPVSRAGPRNNDPGRFGTLRDARISWDQSYSLSSSSNSLTGALGAMVEMACL